MNWLEELLKGMRGNSGALQLGGANEGNGGVTMNDSNQGGGLGSLLSGLFSGPKAGPDAEAEGKVSFNNVQAPQPEAPAPGSSLLGGLLKFDDEGDKKKFLRNGLDFGLGMLAESSEMKENHSLLGDIANAGRSTLAGSDTRDEQASQNLFKRAQMADTARKSTPMYQATSAMAQKGFVPNPDGSFSRLPGLQAIDDAEIAKEDRRNAAIEARDARRYEQQDRLQDERTQAAEQRARAADEARAQRDANKPMSPTEKKEIWQTQETVQTIDQSLRNLDRMEALNGTWEKVKQPDGSETEVFRPGKVVSGALSGLRQNVSRNLPTSWVSDDLTGEINATGEYENLTKADSLTKLKTVLTGPTSDRDVQTVTELGASLEKTPQERAQIIRNSRAALQAQREFQRAKLSDMGVGMPGQNPMAPGGVDRGPLAPMDGGNMPTITDPNDPWLRDPNNRGKPFRVPGRDKPKYVP